MPKMKTPTPTSSSDHDDLENDWKEFAENCTNPDAIRKLVTYTNYFVKHGKRIPAGEVKILRTLTKNEHTPSDVLSQIFQLIGEPDDYLSNNKLNDLHLSLIIHPNSDADLLIKINFVVKQPVFKELILTSDALDQTQKDLITLGLL